MSDQPVLTMKTQRHERYAYRECVFTIERHGLLWWCHNGIKSPYHAGTMCSLQHEAGFGSLTRRGILRKLARACRRHLRDEASRAALNGRQPDARLVSSLRTTTCWLERMTTDIHIWEHATQTLVDGLLTITRTDDSAAAHAIANETLLHARAILGEALCA